MIESKILFIITQCLSFLLLCSALQGNETNRDDLNSIESDFEDKLRTTDFKSNLIINNLSLNQLKQLYLKHRERGQLNFDLKSFYDKRPINCSHNLNKEYIYTMSLYVENNSSREQTLFTPGFKRTISKTNEINFTRTFGFSVSAGVGIKIPFKNWKIGAGIEFEANFSQYESVKVSITENETVIAPKQPINVNPYSKIMVTYNVYKYTDLWNYYLDFEVVPHAKELFTFFLKRIGNMEYGQGDLRLEYLNSTPIMRNFFETEKLPGLGVDVLIHPEENISQNIQVIQIL